MGCDIHLCIEHQLPADDTWLTFATKISLSRNYLVFGRLAGVRGKENALVQPRGFPGDAWTDTREELEGWEGMAHTPTWLSLNEWKAAMNPSVTADYHAVTAVMEVLESGGHKTRAVFWFDN